MKIKICGMTRQSDADAANRLGAEFCGFIFHNGSQRLIKPDAVARLRTGRMARVGVFVEQTANEIREIMQIAQLDYAQLHGNQTAADAEAVGAERVIRVIWPERYASLAELTQKSRYFPCAYFLLDAGINGGGSGRQLEWEDLRGIDLGRPWILAGGLSALNLASAIRACAPWGVDLNSCLEDAPGQKNHEKMMSAIQAARGVNL